MEDSTIDPKNKRPPDEEVAPEEDAYAGLGAEDALRVMRAAAGRMGGRDG